MPTKDFGKCVVRVVDTAVIEADEVLQSVLVPAKPIPAQCEREAHVFSG